MVPVTLDYSMEMDHDGRPYMVEVKGLPLLRCDQCGAKLLPDSSLEIMENELRRMAGLLMPAEITKHRERLSLSQKEFAWLLGIAPATVSRWETGGQIQQRAMNDFMNVVFNVREAREFLMRRRGARVPELPDVSSGSGTKVSDQLQNTHLIIYRGDNTIEAPPVKPVEAMA
jgi:putative zinc finger/helix-turn-helix YgiT family protein